MATVLAPRVATDRSPADVSGPTRFTRFLSDPRRALCAAVLILSASVGLDALGDPDVWWHLRLGQWIVANHRIPTAELFSYTAAGNPLLAHEWLSDTIFALLATAGGLLLVSTVMAMVAWSGIVATALRGRLRGAGPFAIALGVVLGAKAAEPVLGTRPQVFTVALLCWTLWIADTYLRRGGRRLWLLPPLFLLWANLHAGFLAGIGFLVLVMAAELIKRRLQPALAADVTRVRGLAIATAASALAACINPAGALLYRFALTVSATERQKPIVEWHSPNFQDPGMWAFLAFLLTFAMLVLVALRLRRRDLLDLRDVILAAVGIAMALLAVRYTAVCVVLVAPLWMSLAAVAGRQPSARRASARRPVRATGSAVLLGVTVIAAGVFALGYVFTRVQAASAPAGVAAAYPSCAADVLARSPSPQRVFSAYGAAGYVIYRLWPHASVYEYGESISLGSTVFDDYVRIAGDARTTPTAVQLLRDSGTTAVLYPISDLTAQLDAAPGWTRVLNDHGMLLYVSGDAAWAAGSSCPS